MSINAYAPQKAFAGIRSDGPTITEQITVFFTEHLRSHSAKNVVIWKSYLPEDCIKSMVDMGWDYTT
jgi:hypothetical protein